MTKNEEKSLSYLGFRPPTTLRSMLCFHSSFKNLKDTQKGATGSTAWYIKSRLNNAIHPLPTSSFTALLLGEQMGKSPRKGLPLLPWRVYSRLLELNTKDSSLQPEFSPHFPLSHCHNNNYSPFHTVHQLPGSMSGTENFPTVNSYPQTCFLSVK